MSLSVVRAGMLSTIQDAGRHGYRHLGVPVGGAADLLSLRVGNLLLGNDRDAAAIEVTLGGLALRASDPCSLAVTGHGVSVELNGRHVPVWLRLDLAAGDLLKVQYTGSGARSYVCAAGAIRVPPVLGSASTGLVAGLGGFEGRALRRGDVLELGAPPATVPAAAAVRAPERGEIIRVLPGPEWGLLDASVQKALLAQPWQVSVASNRMGLRLQGAALDFSESATLLSHAVLPGVVQLPSGGAPILLLADAQTTGGYPKPLVVIAADLWRAAQLAPTDRLRFVLVTPDDALYALKRQQRWLSQLERSLQWHTAST
ncbi:biotin-dependent carboxyltransferase family protein [Chitinibacteraceae bacterium HSL-7]